MSETRRRRARERRFTLLPWLPVGVLGAVMVPGVILAPSGRFDPPGLLASLNFLFQTMIPLAAAAIAVAAYRRTGVAAVLALGAGMLATAVGCGILPAILLLGRAPNLGITVHNSAAAIAAAAHLAAALGGIAGITFGPARIRHLVIAYGGVIVLIVAVVLGSQAGIVPPFWQEGATPLRMAVLAVGALLFWLAGFAWWQTEMRDQSIRFLRWYVPGLALFGMGLAVMISNGVLGGLLSWLGRTGQYAGAVYLLVAVLPEAFPVIGSRRPGTDRDLGIALLQAALPFRPLVESTSDAVIAVGRTGRVLYWNEAAHRLFGYTGAEAFDRDPVELILPHGSRQEVDVLRALFHAPADEVPTITREIHLAHRSGTPFVAEVSTLAGAEDPRLVVGVIADITERVRSREELERLVVERTTELATTNQELASANAELARANASKDEFLGLVSHELKTPITSILAASSILQRRGTADGLAEDIGVEAVRLGGIVDNLLALARLDSGTRGEFEPLPLDRAVRRSVAAIERQHPDRAIELSVEHGVIVEGNEDQLAMVLRNYLVNAIKYSPAGSVVQVHLRKVGDSARLAVLDEGPGIGDGQAADLFEPFRRGERTESIPGMGIGLTVCRRIVEVHGGSVGASSRADGPGSIFWLELPLVDAMDGAEEVDRELVAGSV